MRAQPLVPTAEVGLGASPKTCGLHGPKVRPDLCSPCTGNNPQNNFQFPLSGDVYRDLSIKFVLNRPRGAEEKGGRVLLHMRLCPELPANLASARTWWGRQAPVACIVWLGKGRKTSLHSVPSRCQTFCRMPSSLHTHARHNVRTHTKTHTTQQRQIPQPCAGSGGTIPSHCA